MKTCTAEELKRALESDDDNLMFIDVRTPREYEKGHIKGFINIPLGADPEDFERFKGGTLYLICLSGGRSDQACLFLDDLGFQNVISVEGGMLTWRVKGFPVTGGS